MVNRFELFEEGEKRVGVIVGCGPSLAAEQLDKVAHLRKFGANRAFEFGMDVLVGCNWQFWHHYWDQVRDLDCIKWATRDHHKMDGFAGMNYISTKFMPGLSTDTRLIADHHGSGPQTLNIALHYQCDVMLLIGWDMRYLGKVDRRNYTGKRHFFGEDALTSGHFPMTGSAGELTGLINNVATIKPADYGIEIINCTPDSAMRCFPMMDLDEAIEKYT